MSQTLQVDVWRGGADGHYQTFEVPHREHQTVLDVVTYIQRELDPSLSYRYACRVGMCGSCAMSVNGKARWTCRTHVKRVVEHGRLRLAPLDNLPRIKDLATDMAPFFDKIGQARGTFVPTRTRHDPFAAIAPDSPARASIDEAIECIGCGVCYASCDTVAWNPDYLGPAALNRAWTLMQDSRDAAHAERLLAVAGDAGCHACHTHMSCTERCPKQLSPTASIAGLKRLALGAALKGEL
ncbi:succinate dehydrogenase/fumarate reductase iron-sulfur subunit [Stutzerimonas azotifigens]|uniref:succinate dehydrogenase/fumarate reductase iron-sulfur subunit n=1 Tax=Stutzerimonas azotifigens TaxID=291995 RepID=UPI00040A9D3F|nr:succinate dehydrogenase/fumarate reductase iron-sulfur subunit [Stutzerimonas azotifigens]